MRIKRNKLDIAFSQLVRTRANWKCLKCGGDFSDGGLDCCHIMGRRSVGLRWHPDNAIAMCRGHHMWFTERPFDFRDFCVEHFGEERVAELRLVSNQVVKWSPKVREEIFKHMKEQLKAGTFEPHELMYEFTDESGQTE